VNRFAFQKRNNTELRNRRGLKRRVVVSRQQQRYNLSVDVGGGRGGGNCSTHDGDKWMRDKCGAFNLQKALRNCDRELSVADAGNAASPLLSGKSQPAAAVAARWRQRRRRRRRACGNLNTTATSSRNQLYINRTFLTFPLGGVKGCIYKPEGPVTPVGPVSLHGSTQLILLPFLPMPQNSTFASTAAPIVGIQAA
jgi:hypothetical protein